MRFLPMSLAAVAVLAACGGPASRPLLNVSYDPTRELFQDYNAVFVRHFKETTGRDIRISMSHDGSGKQARSVIEGLQADVVTLALDVDIDAIAKAGRLPADWKSRLPLGSAPYTSTIVFLVRRGNPKNIRDWADLARPDVGAIQPDPRTSGGARWNYLAMWAWADRAFAHDEAKIRAYVGAVYRNSPKLDTGGRGATLTFAANKLGDVLVGWETDAFFAVEQYPDQGYEIVYPSMSILAQPPVALVDQNVDRHKLRDVAEDYLRFLYSREGQKVAVRHFFRPSHPELVDPKALERFKPIERVSVDEAFGGWAAAQKKHFAEGGTFDQIFESR